MVKVGRGVNSDLVGHRAERETLFEYLTRRATSPDLFVRALIFITGQLVNVGCSHDVIRQAAVSMRHYGQSACRWGSGDHYKSFK